MRDRLSWKRRKKNKKKRRKRKSKSKQRDKEALKDNADPYWMNQDHDQPPTEEYMIGDPSAWAEEPVDDLSDMDETERNEIGLAEMLDTTFNHKDVNEWEGDMPYDNAWSFNNDELERESSLNKMAKIKRKYEKKALHCVKIADAMLSEATDLELAEQALDLMSLPEDSIVETALRIEENSKSSKETKSAKDMLREMLSEDDEDEDEEEEDEEEEDEDEEDEEEDEDEEEGKESSLTHEDMLREMMEEDEEEGDENLDEEEEKESNQVEDEEIDALLDDVNQETVQDEVSDDEVDAMMSDFDMDQSSPSSKEANAGNSVGVDFSTDMDGLSGDELLDESDKELSALMDRHYSVDVPEEDAPKVKQKEASNNGINELGGRVKGASSNNSADEEIEKLSGCWEVAPEVNKTVFND